MQTAGLNAPESYRFHAEFLKSGGREAVEHLFSLDSPPTGLVISDDLISFGVLSMLEEFGFSVAGDISIVSFNNVYLSEIIRPALTMVDVKIHTLGVQSAKINRKNNE